MERETRNTLNTTVGRCRALLEDAIGKTLESEFGIRPDGTVLDDTRMGHLSEGDKNYRCQLIDHFGHIKAKGISPEEAREQLVREASFTHLNRLCAYKIMEKRKLVRECVSKGVLSNGFIHFRAHNKEADDKFVGGEQYGAYKQFLRWLGQILSQEIGVLFSPEDISTRLFPPQHMFEKIVEMLNDPQLDAVWEMDETIGWVYQYFIPKEARDKSRTESYAPRSSYELAFRNQFFTPRYVVEFLTDNTLGRIWYEMVDGHTILSERCKKMMIRPGENTLPREKKDPRDILIMDPACGSGHFLLYCYDLMETIYMEAWNNPKSPPYSVTGNTLRDDFADESELRKNVPGMILRYNLHGIDIDLRATQIASLALWLRAQRSFTEMGLGRPPHFPAPMSPPGGSGERPVIRRANIICAEPMPGEGDMLNEFVSELNQDNPKAIGQLVDVIFNKMRRASEAGSLLKIEEMIKEAIDEARRQYLSHKKPGSRYSSQKTLDGDILKKDPTQVLFSSRGITSDDFFNEAEGAVIEALSEYSAVVGEASFRKKLFAEDTEQGFGFVELSLKQYDVVLMNPPFGEFCKSWKEEARERFPNAYNDIYAAFVERWLEKLVPGGRLGAITSRSCFFLTSFSNFRSEVLMKKAAFSLMADLGMGVMDDAMVEAAAYCIERSAPESQTLFVRLLKYSPDEKEAAMSSCITDYRKGAINDEIFAPPQHQFSILDDSPFVYWVDENTLNNLTKFEHFEPAGAEIKVGLQTGDDFRFVRALWEVPIPNLKTDCENGIEMPNINPLWVPFVKAGSSQPFFSPITLTVNWGMDGHDLKNFKDSKGKPRAYPRNMDKYFYPGFSWTLRAVRLIPYIVPGGCIPSVSRYVGYPKEGKETIMVGLAASNFSSAFMRFYGEKFEWPKFLVENVKLLPYTNFEQGLSIEIQKYVQGEVESRRLVYSMTEPFQEFTLPTLLQCGTKEGTWDFDPECLLDRELDKKIYSSYGIIDDDSRDKFERDLQEAIRFRNKVMSDNVSESGSDSEDEETDNERQNFKKNEREKADELISYAVGVVFGRWDVRMVADKSLIPQAVNAFAPMPRTPPGSLLGIGGLPATANSFGDMGYPIAIDWDGILVDDPNHTDDIVARTRAVFEHLWGKDSYKMEMEICTNLEIRGSELRNYFTNSSKGFFTDHIRRYSKSRRKAPIYWLLQSKRKSYGVWIYCHRLDRDTVFKIMENYVRPRISMEEARVESLRARHRTAEGAEARKIGKELEKSESLMSELRDFKEKLQRVADLDLDPDLNDGVILNMAPYWELIPWKEPEKYWKELLNGKYEWSTIGKQLRSVGAVKDQNCN